jgi:hypothetical protein
MHTQQCSGCATSTCFGCFKKYLEFKISAGQVAPDQLVCPGPCRRPIATYDLRLHLDERHIEKYSRYLANHFHVQAGGRYCPRLDCGQPLRTTPKGKGKKRKVICSSCNETSCIDCGQAYHLFPLCERQYHSWCRAQNTQTCPRCEWTIQKDGGCQHMTCSRCAFEFCWLCRRIWSEHRSDWELLRCVPLALIHSKHRCFGPAPIRVITKTIVAGGAVGLAMVAIPPVWIYNCLSQVHNRHRYRRRLRLLQRVE